ncbi:MAG: hypothetical protein R3D29_02505 [Nitratireductor sp.]
MLDEFAARYVYFLAGYMFANRIFDLSDWAIANHGRRCCCCWPGSSATHS